MLPVSFDVRNNRNRHDRCVRWLRQFPSVRTSLDWWSEGNLPVDQIQFQSNALGLWLAIFVIIVSQVAIFQWSHLSVAFSPKLSINICACFILAVLGLFFTYRDFRPRVALIASSVAQLVATSIALCVLTYSLTALAGSTPLRDEALAAMDGRLGFHWMDILHWGNAHPYVSDLGGDAYGSIAKQALAVVFLLGLLRDSRRLQSAVYAYMIALTLTAVVSFFVPALGTYAFFNVDPTFHPNVTLRTAALPVADIRALRDHVLTLFELENVKGIISFPSFHSALGVLFIWCFWPVPGVRWVGAALNLAMIAATPLHGSHYLTDVLAGLLIGLTAISLSVRLHAAVELRWGTVRRQAAEPIVGPRVFSPSASTVDHAAGGVCREAVAPL